MHIGLVVWALFDARGGIERFGTNLAAEMMRRGHSVTLFHASKRDPADRPKHPIPTGAQCIGLPRDRRSPTLVSETRKILVNSGIDVLAALFSWDEVLRFPAALTDIGIPLLISEHNTPHVIEGRWNPEERRACLNAADRIHLLSPSFRAGTPLSLQDQIEVIPNPITKKRQGIPEERETSEKKTILGMGRFNDHHKQFSLLIKAFALLAERFPDWNLTLCGDGDDRENYKKLVSVLNMQGRVLMPGMVEDVDTYYSASHLFCSSSLFEGCPLVVLDAQCFALPTVGFSQCPGTNDIVVHGENGLLAEEMSAECLARNLAILMADSSMRLRMSQRTQEMLDRHDEKIIHDRWESMLTQTAGMKNNTRLQKIFNGQEEETPDIVLLKNILGRTPLFKKKSRLKKLQDSAIKVAKGIVRRFS